MSKSTNDKDTSDLEREFEEEMKKEKRPEESLLPEEAEFEKEYDEEMQNEELPKRREIDPYAEKFYELSTRKFKTEAELDNAVSKILNEIERDYFFKGLLKKTKKGGKLLQKGLATFKGLPAFQAANAITQLVRGNLKVTLGTLAKIALRGMQAGTTLPVLKALGFEAGNEETEQNREAWQNFTNVCKESFDYLARNLNENADDPLEASKLASEAFSAALKKVESERKSASIQRTRKLAVAKPSSKKIVNRTIPLVLGMICILLVAGLVGAIAVYSPMVSNLESQIAEKDNLISSMNSTISSLQDSLNQSSTSAAAKDSQIAALNYQISNLFNYINLNVSALLVYNQTIYQNAGANTTIYYDMVQFAGYITVEVQSSSNTTYVGLVYSSYGVNYNSTITVGTVGTAAFPVLPGALYINVGNTETADAVAAIVTATYTY
jgi:hypothetical protein